jgi:hypothetical protein
MLAISQYQALLLQSFKKVHNFFLNDSITLIYNLFFSLYESTIIINIKVNFFHFIYLCIYMIKIMFN